MIGTTGLEGLRIDCIVGVYPFEREQAQPIVIDIELDYDFGDAAGADDVRHAVDYDLVARGTTELVQERKFQLIETMAEEVASMLLAQHAAVKIVRLAIRKPNAVPAAASSFVRIERNRGAAPA